MTQPLLTPALVLGACLLPASATKTPTSAATPEQRQKGATTPWRASSRIPPPAAVDGALRLSAGASEDGSRAQDFAWAPAPNLSQPGSEPAPARLEAREARLWRCAVPCLAALMPRCACAGC